MARTLRGPTQRCARDHWALRLRASPAIHRLHSRDVRLPIVVADILTLAMFLVLLLMYIRLARSEEQEAIASFGDAYRRYSATVPAFIQSLFRPASAPRS